VRAVGEARAVGWRDVPNQLSELRNDFNRVMSKLMEMDAKLNAILVWIGEGDDDDFEEEADPE
jgi:hypothetical protein